VRNNLVHPALRAGIRFMPRIDVTRWTLGFMRLVAPLAVPRRRVPGVSLREVSLSAGNGRPPVRVRIHRPDDAAPGTPALLWIHGGGHLLGTAAMDDRLCGRYAKELGITVIAPEYRLAPEHPFPADLEDCYTALAWAAQARDELGIDAANMAIGGASAGGGLAAALAQLARDRREVSPVFQLLVYPMLDDRTATRTDIDEAGFHLWHQRSNRYAWQAYLRSPPGSAAVPAYAVPARCDDLAGLPSAWIGVGTLDLFHDEDLAYARRLRDNGVACETVVVAGAYHGFDIWSPGAAPSRQFFQAQVDALRTALFPSRLPVHCKPEPLQ